jgi:trehalose utilization protein
MNITVWNEFVHEQTNPIVKNIYPNGIHQVIAKALESRIPDATVRCATLDQPEHGLDQATLDQTDVLFWWGHASHDKVSDEVVDRVQARVLNGMGLIVLHSGHASKIFRKLMGTSCMLRWREAGERERLWIVSPSHPIVEGFENEFFEVPAAEMYGEYFDIPQPNELIFVSWFEGGEVFRSGCTFLRGKGKIFYFRPGHETYPIYYQNEIQQVLAQAALWARPSGSKYYGEGRNILKPVSPISSIKPPGLYE